MHLKYGVSSINSSLTMGEDTVYRQAILAKEHGDELPRDHSRTPPWKPRAETSEVNFGSCRFICRSVITSSVHRASADV